MVSSVISTVCAQPGSPAAAATQTPPPFTYADVADLAAPARIIAVARIRSLTKVEAKALASPPGRQIFYLEAQVTSLIRGETEMPPRIGFLADFPSEVNAGRMIKGKTMILFGRAGTQPGQIQLLSSRAMLPWSPGADIQLRAIVRELLATDAPPDIAGVAEAFHVEGTVAGESETQVFLATRSGRPISLSIIRRPDMEPRFGAALGEIVDEAADVPAPNTLLWYRLACGLPAALPMGSVSKLDQPSAEAAAADYRSFLTRLAPCDRTRPPLLLGKGGDPG
jgi:hypothetical protein